MIDVGQQYLNNGFTREIVEISGQQVRTVMTAPEKFVGAGAVRHLSEVEGKIRRGEWVLAGPTYPAELRVSEGL